MPNETIEARAKTKRDGTLDLHLQVGLVETEVAVIIKVSPITQAGKVDANGWPEGFFERVAGSMPNLERGSQGNFEERLPLE